MPERSWRAESGFVPDLDAAREIQCDGLRPGDIVLVKASNGSGSRRLDDELMSSQTATVAATASAAARAAGGTFQ